MRKIPNDELGRPSAEAFETMKKRPIVVVLDNVRSMHNVGSAFRTADAFAIESLCLCGITAQPPHRDINKAALGATETVHWKYFAQTIDAIAALKAEGFKIYSVEQVEGSTSLNTVQQSDEKIALVFGHEMRGVSQQVIDRSDGFLEIPQYGTKHSLNVSVSIGIVLWELVRD